MAERPYFESSASDLEAAAQRHWHSVPELQNILGELRRRTTARAQRIEREVAARVVSLGGNIESGGDEQGGASKTSSQTDARVQDLTMRAVRAEQLARELEERLRAAQAEIDQLGNRPGDELDGLYAMVGLRPSCPDFLFKVAWRAFRKEYHPDALSDRPKPEQLAAQERFKEFDNVFNKLRASRGQHV